MISYKILISILVIHWLADFALQTHDQASQKSTNTTMLLKHVLTYSFVWIWGAWLLVDTPEKIVLFVMITFISHIITDFWTSKFVKVCFDNQDYHNGFVVIGADQILHYVQLFLTYKLLT